MKNKTTQGLGNKNLLSFPKHDSLKYRRLKSNVNSHMSIQYVNQSVIRVTILITVFRFVRRQMVSPKKVFHNPLSNSCHRSGKGHV
jgi:hypothetical protein